MSTIDIILSLAWVPWFVLCMLLDRKIKRLERENLKLSKRPVGRVISTTLTEEGLLVKGEIFDDGVFEKMGQDMVGMSIGYSVDAVNPFKAPEYEYGIDHATLFVEPEMTKIRSISLDKEPNAWGYFIHLADCPAKNSKGVDESCICRPGREPVSFDPMSTDDGSPPTTPDYNGMED